ncbi:hypothetical protein BC939DRAFT_524412, partial [Gamsiella multidivaricata]|uniref:uncharacterized protein n=1 Tax=Gamsiella multidivaricata TaxID=101098 RepID=UPI0022205CDC
MYQAIDTSSPALENILTLTRTSQLSIMLRRDSRPEMTLVSPVSLFCHTSNTSTDLNAFNDAYKPPTRSVSKTLRRKTNATDIVHQFFRSFSSVDPVSESSMVASYSSAKLAPPVSHVVVEAVEVRAGPCHWFTIRVHPCPIVIPGSDAAPIPRRSYCVYRQYEDIADFAARLEGEASLKRSSQAGPQHMFLSFNQPSLPKLSPRDKSMVHSRKKPRRPHTVFDADSLDLRVDVSNYFQELFASDESTGRCRLAAEFFGIWKTDLEAHLSQDDQDPLALQTVGPQPPPSKLPATVVRSVALPIAFRYGSDTSSVTTPSTMFSSPTSSSSCSSISISPTLSPSKVRIGSDFPWDTKLFSQLAELAPPSTFSLYASSLGSSYHADVDDDDDEDNDEDYSDEDDNDEDDNCDDGNDDESYGTDTDESISDSSTGCEEEANALSMIPPLRTLKKMISFQNLRKHFRGENDLSPLRSGASTSSEPLKSLQSSQSLSKVPSRDKTSKRKRHVEQVAPYSRAILSDVFPSESDLPQVSQVTRSREPPTTPILGPVATASLTSGKEYLATSPLSISPVLTAGSRSEMKRSEKNLSHYSSSKASTLDDQVFSSTVPSKSPRKSPSGEAEAEGIHERKSTLQSPYPRASAARWRGQRERSASDGVYPDLPISANFKRGLHGPLAQSTKAQYCSAPIDAIPPSSSHRLEAPPRITSPLLNKRISGSVLRRDKSHSSNARRKQR